MKYRLDQNKIEITKSEHPIIDLESFTMEEKMDDLRKRKNKENLKWEYFYVNKSLFWLKRF